MRPREKAGFTVIELLVVVAIVALLLGLLLPALGSARKTANKLMNQSNVASVSRYLIVWANEHERELPSTNPITAPDIASDNTGTERMEVLVNHGLSSELLLNPIDKKSVYVGGDLTTNNLSYAVLNATSSEWNDNTSSQAPLFADRLLPGNGSVWDDTAWQGAVAWGDAHATHEEDQTMLARFGGAAPALRNIFSGTADALYYD